MKKRKESFWGLHFDFHAKPTDEVQGKTLTEEKIQWICDTLKPDFIQIDCKGHPGWASYPSKLGNALPEFAFDTLKLWRKVTKEKGVALYMHYSGVFDRKYCSEHPDQRVLMGDGTFHNESTRLNGKYVDELLIPQLMELAGDYGVNGVWIDGDCWMALSDFSPETIDAFQRKTGIDLKGKLPTSEGDPYYHEYREYNRELYRRYMRRYVDALHEKYPDFEICSNWAFSDHMPEDVSANVDFLSGDLNPMNSFNSARYAARALAQQKGYAWDLMSWNFRNSVGTRRGFVTKHPNQLKQEAAAVISVGGAYQNYVTQLRDGSPKMWELHELIGLAEFVLARRPYCHRGTPVPQAALLLSTCDRAHEARHLYSRTGYEKVMGMTALLCDVGQSLEVLCEHSLKGNMDKYKMIVVPELYFGLEDGFVKELLEYAQNGGNLVLTGKKTCSLFEKAGAPYSCKEYQEYEEQQVTQNGHANVSTNIYKPYIFTLNGFENGTLFSPCEIITDDENVNSLFDEKPNRKGNYLSATIPFGKGTVTAIGFDVGSQYLSSTQYMHRELIKKIVDNLYVPTVRLESACGRLEIMLLDKDGKLMIQLLNAGGTHADLSSATDDYIPPVLDIKLSIALPKEPKSIVLQPEGKELPFAYENARATLQISRVDIHSIIEICE